MSREFKFRVWATSEGCWFVDEEFYIRLDGSLCELGVFSYASDGTAIVDGVEVVERDQYIIQQFTWSLDKNGKEIFEGDIVKFYGSILEVAHNLRHMGFMGRDKSKNEVTYLVPSELEVIGNIFENPKLLDESAMDQRLVKAAPKAGSISRAEAKRAVARVISKKKRERKQNDSN